MTDPRPSEVQALAALLHQRTWLTHDVPQESPCGYCERVALWLDGQGVGVRVAPSPTPADGLQHDGHMIVHVAACEACYPQLQGADDD